MRRLSSLLLLLTVAAACGGDDDGATPDAATPDAPDTTPDAAGPTPDAAPFCTPGASEACYTGPAGTENVGVCVAGTHTCNASGTAFGPCSDVVPSAEDCATPADEDCDATPLCAALWARRAGDAQDQLARAVAVDGTGAVIVVGELLGSANLGGGDLTSAGSTDVLVAKLDAAGNHVWSKRFGAGGSQGAFAVAVDDAGNVVVTGYASGAIDFGGGVLTSAGGFDVFVAKLDGNGNHVWSKIAGDAQQQLGHGVAVDATGAVYVVGAFAGTLDFGAPLTSAGGDDAFVVKLEAGGGLVAAKRFGDAAAQAAYAVATDDMRVVVVGELAGSADFGGGALTSAGGTDLFVAAFDVVLSHLWSRRAGDDAAQTATGVAIDAVVGVVVVGVFQGAIDLGSGPLTSAGGVDALVAAYDLAGAPVWSRAFGGGGDERPNGVALAPGAGVLVGGAFSGAVDFGPATIGDPMLTSAGGEDAFLVRLLADGATLWARRFGHVSPYQGIYGVAVAPDGGAVVAGGFTGAVDLGLGPLFSSGALDLLIGRFPPP